MKSRFLKEFAKVSIDVELIDASQHSIIEGFENYMGVIGSPYSALRFIRAASD